MNPNGKRKKAGGGNFLGFVLFLLIGACCGFLMIKPMENALDMGNFPLAILFFRGSPAVDVRRLFYPDRYS